MATTQATKELFPEVQPPAGVVIINSQCIHRTQDGYRVVVVRGVVVAQYMITDCQAEAYTMVSLVAQGAADQNDVARAFGRTPRTLRRYEARFEVGGLAALGSAGGYPGGRSRLPLTRARHIHRLKAKGFTNRQIAEQLGVTENAIRKQLRRLGWKEPKPVEATLPFEETDHTAPVPPVASTEAPNSVQAEERQAAHPNLSAFSVPVQSDTPQQSPNSAHPNLSAFSSAEHEVIPFAEPRKWDGTTTATERADEEPPPTFDTDPSDRRMDRLFAYLGLLDDAAPLFRAGLRVSGAGVLLAVPALLASGVLESAREVYGDIGPAFYGLRTSLMSLLLMALLRIKRPEALKERAPEDLGRILGLDRAPEVKTIRRKLARLAVAGKAAQFGRALAQRRIAERGAAMGFLYVDGHVRVYHGQHPIPKTHVARLRLPHSGTTDYWVNDAMGDPLFVVTAEANAGLVKMLPPILTEIRALVGERRVTVVFDRGGFSPKLFAQLFAAGFDILTYRRGRFRRVAKKNFREHEGCINGRVVRYTLADQGVQLTGGVRLRQVMRLTPDGHQTPILTTRRDLPALEVAYRMFERWRQENFFKYLREEYALDALVEYAIEADNPARDVPNPAVQAATARLRKLRAIVAELQAQYGQAAFDDRRHSLRGFKLVQAELGRKLREALRRCEALKQKRAKLPPRVPVVQAAGGKEVVRLAAERQHLSNLLKMVAYQAESDLVHLVSPFYRRAEDEGRTLIQSALASAADIEVTKNELRIRLMPLSSPHRSRALAALCNELNAARTSFPATKLVLHFSVSADSLNCGKADNS